jgi:hypothetical protein
MGKKKGAQSAKNKAAPEATSGEPVLLWSFTMKGEGVVEFVGTEDEAEKGRAQYEKEQGKAAKKKMLETLASGPLFERYERSGSFTVNSPDDESDEEEEPADEAPETFTDAEEALAATTLEKLRASDKALTVAELHPETNEEGSAGYVAAGQIDKVLKKMLVPRGLAAQDGEAFVAVRPGALASRRAELLAAVAKARLESDDTHAIADATEAEDAAALEKAGLAFISRDDDGDGPAVVWANDEMATAAISRGAIVLVAETMTECRESGASVIVDGDAGAALAKAETALRVLDAKLDVMWKDLGIARSALSVKTGEVETLRGWFRTNNMAFPLDKPEVPKPPREEFTHTITPSVSDKGRMYGIRLTLTARLAEVDAAFAVAKETHKTRSVLLNGQLKSLDDAVTGMFYDAPAFRRVDLQRGVAQIVHASDESWVLEEKELRSEQIEAEKAKAEEAAKPAPATVAPPAADGAMRIIPPGEEHGSEVAGTLAAAVASPGFAEKYATAIGKDVTVDTSGTVPVISVSDRPKAPPLNPASVRAEVEKFCNDLQDDTLVSVADMTERLAKAVWGVEHGTEFAGLVKLAFRAAHKAGTIHYELSEGVEKIGKVRAAKAAPAASTTTIDNVLGVIRAAGAKGMAPGDVTGEGVVEAVEALKERGAIVHNGKRGKGARLVAKEFVANGASAEASA